MQLNVTTRESRKKQVQQLRDQGIIPGIVYGHKKDNKIVQVALKDLQKAYREAGESSLIDLVIDAETPLKVVIHAIDKDHVTDAIQHVDFYAVTMTEKIHSEVMLNFIGEPPAVKTLGGIFVKNKDHLNIVCLPGALIKQLDVDCTILKTFDDVIYIKNIPLPDGVEIDGNVEDIVAVVTPPRSDEEIAALSQSVSEDVSKVEGVTKPTDIAGTTAAGDKKDDKKAEKKTDKK